MGIKVNVPDGESGGWKVDTFLVDEDRAEAFNFGQALQGTYERRIVPGIYKRLLYTNNEETEIVMSNTPAEISDHDLFFRVLDMVGDNASVLINGLGLGMALSVVLKNPKITEVTVIEKSQHVIKLVSPSFDDPRLTIINADALEWKAPVGKRYSIVWHDIWNSISTKNSKTMGTLHRKYGKRCDWQSSWCRKEMKAMMRQ